MEKSKEMREVITGISLSNTFYSTGEININPLNENCRLSTETEIFVVFAEPEESQDTRYIWRLCEDSERRDASLISQSLPLCFCEISPSQAGRWAALSVSNYSSSDSPQLQKA